MAAINWEIPSKWQLKKLHTLATEDTEQVQPYNYPNELFNYWSLAAVDEANFQEPQPNWIRGNEIASTCVKFNDSHILYARLRPYLNKVIVPTTSGTGSTEWVVLKPIAELIDRRYLAYVLRSPNFVHYAANNSTGARLPRLRKKDLQDAEIPIPYPDDPARSLDVQRRIVTRIETLLAEVRDMRRLQADIAESTGQLMDAVLAEIYAVNQHLPNGWELKELGDVCQTTSGGTPSRRHPEYFEGNIPWVKSGELTDGLVNCVEECITEEAEQNSSAKRFPKGTLLIAMYGATVGKLGILEMEAATNQAVCAIFPQEAIERDFLFYFLRAIRKNLTSTSIGGAQPNISQKIIKSIKVPIPFPNTPKHSLEVQRHIIARLDAINNELQDLKNTNQKTTSELTELEQSILAQAFQGEL